MIKSPGTPNPKHSAVSEWDPAGKFTVIIEFGEVPNDPIGAVNVNDVSNDLLFITNKAKPGGGGRQDHVQFSIISIREEDYEQLMSNRDVNHPCINQSKHLGII
ncbi:hypothetical protein [Vulcanisaeta sp. EB80]|jgi:hypothetical protein|uniref:hypothetical protein n=1 Tax=Vulcanisaeta sp. EB80 TaxID=1650660 RepID=UPI001EE43C9E|nr:hypothetical protein [Vulcanisaeta sp. EB80]